jgi:hypothetical protein
MRILISFLLDDHRQGREPFSTLTAFLVCQCSVIYCPRVCGRNFFEQVEFIDLIILDLKV